jgi:DNA-binding LytR/AlgR family response regulator
MKNYRSQTIRRIKNKPEQLLIISGKPQLLKDVPNLSDNRVQTEILKLSTQNSENLFRLFVKKGEYVYARPNDIIMIESCDHLVKVYVAVEGKVKLTTRYNTLKDFLSQLPETHFIRLGRFCAINIQRLTGGNCNEQAFEFDFKISIKLKHTVSHSVFSGFGK